MVPSWGCLHAVEKKAPTVVKTWLKISADGETTVLQVCWFGLAKGLLASQGVGSCGGERLVCIGPPTCALAC